MLDRHNEKAVRTLARSLGLTLTYGPDVNAICAIVRKRREARGT